MSSQNTPFTNYDDIQCEYSLMLFFPCLIGRGDPKVVILQIRIFGYSTSIFWCQPMLLHVYCNFFFHLLLPRNMQDLHSPSMNHREAEVEEKPQKSLNEKQQENQELLIRCVSQPLGFAGNRPIAACIIYKCLLHWRSFEVERTSIFDRIIQTIGHAIEVCNLGYTLFVLTCMIHGSMHSFVYMVEWVWWSEVIAPYKLDERVKWWDHMIIFVMRDILRNILKWIMVHTNRDGDWREYFSKIRV